MNSIFVEDAVKNVWCTPSQDKQIIIEPAKISPFNGVWNNINLVDREIKLPLLDTRFHVYQFGTLFPDSLGLPNIDSNWTLVSEACGLSNLIINIYNNKGIQLPRVQSWYMITTDRNLLLAVKDQPTINIDLNTEKLFIRVYSNSYFNSYRKDQLNDFISIHGGIVNSTNDILAIQTLVNSYASYTGKVYSFVNGYLVSKIDLISAKFGDIVEFIYDGSISNIIDLKISNLHTFTSELDSARKYLLHHNIAFNDIKYHDDIDFYIIEPLINNRHIGVYYHRNKEDAVRMVTHKDYSLNVAYAAGYAGSRANWTDVSKLTIRMHIRKSGYLRPLILENNRIEELYKLPNALVVKAMVGLNSNVTNWTASNLEKSAYTEIMRSNYSDINISLTQNAYGYNLMSMMLGNTPNNKILGLTTPSFDVPYGLEKEAVIYEYDSNGMLLEWHQHNGTNIYIANNINTDKVEMFTGISDNSKLDDHYGQLSTQLDFNLDYRFYICAIVNNIPTKEWVDVTNLSNYYLINSNNVITWAVDRNNTYTLVRSNKNILSYDLDLYANNSLLKFTLNQNYTVNGIESFSAMEVPLGELDLFMNGYSLIENIDYIVKFPNIVIINKNYLIDILTTAQKITVRFTGLCNSDLTRNISTDTGFIKYNLLSKNNRFDIRDDKVMRIVINGKLHDKSLLQFSESHSGVTVPNINNGLPYSIRDIIVPLRGTAVDDTYTARAASMVIDKRISDYMTTYLPEPVITVPNVIDAMYVVVSPFCSKIIYDLKSGIINDPRLKEAYDESLVFSICKDYEWLLEHDPTQIGNEIDPNYVIVHPHNLNQVIDIDIYSYKFLTKVVKLYMRDKIDLSHFVSIFT